MERAYTDGEFDRQMKRQAPSSDTQRTCGNGIRRLEEGFGVDFEPPDLKREIEREERSQWC